MTNGDTAPVGDDGVPRWVKAFLVALALLLLLLVAAVLTGGHGPGVHPP